ncbi:MAG: DUF4031 domain-containing protein [Actinomycetes bacterium]
MAVLIDPPRWPAYGRLWSHLVSDSSVDELQTFARRAELPARGFEGDHYDVPEERYDRLVALGAQPTEARELLRRLVDSGLRIPKRRGEKVVFSAWLADWLPGAGRQRVDVVLSSLPVPDDAVVGRSQLVTDDAGRLLLTPAVAGWALPEDTTTDAPDNHVGYLRTWLENMPPPGYPYPAPWTFSVVRRVNASGRSAGIAADGRWCTLDEARRLIGDEAVWPLVERALAH